MTLRIKDLDPLYGTVTREEAVAIANMGAYCYRTFKDQLYAAWTGTQTAEETEKAEHWREEGAAAMMESLRARLATGEAATARVTALESSMEAEVLRRVESAAAMWELKKQNEILVLEKQMAEIHGSLKYLSAIEQARAASDAEVTRLSAELAKFKEAATKSSHALGKMGEATVLEMLESHVTPMFMYSEVRDMTKVKHSGDFHVVLNGVTGKRVTVMIDVKKYVAPVDRVEIEKLYSDLDGCDVDVGLMLSLDSGISTKQSFQITKTKGNKPCMFLSFEKLDDGVRREVLCWAIQVLVCLMSVHDTSKRETMLAEIGTLLADLKGEIDQMDTVVKAAKGVYESVRDMRDRILARVKLFRSVCGMEPLVEAAPVGGKAEIRCKGTTKKGAECSGKRLAGGLYCARHAAVAAVPVVTLDGEGDALISHVE
jgi:hypothetical protein